MFTLSIEIFALENHGMALGKPWHGPNNQKETKLQENNITWFAM
jgi:hypothetical protein